ncbi:MAG: DUF424 family protein [Thermoprotei archaeon]|nr:DUF424 family protein [Thermoprotei archaeon]
MGRFHARIIELEDGQLMATIVDEEVLGAKAVDPERGLIIDVKREFYAGTLMGDEEVERLLEEANILILVGARIVRKAVDLGLAHPNSILKIGNLEYTQVYKITY